MAEITQMMKTVKELIKENRSNAQFLAGHARRVRTGMRLVACAQCGLGIFSSVVAGYAMFTHHWFLMVGFLASGSFLCDNARTDWRKGDRFWAESMRWREVALEAANLLEKYGLGN